MCERTVGRWRIVAIIFLTCTFANISFLNAQEEVKPARRVRNLIIPVIFKTPEMGFAAGLSTSITFKTTNPNDTSIRTSLIQGIGFLTTHQQNIQALESTIYFPEENYILLCQIAHTYFPDRFWGLGSDTPDRPYDRFLYEQVYFGPHLKRKISKHLFVGVLYEYQFLYRIKYQPGGIYDRTKFSGKDPYNVSGLGCSLSYDTRNSAFWPSKGLYLLSQLTGFRKELLSDFNLYKYITDIRYFKKVSKSQIMAFQLYTYNTKGVAPLKELAAFGGPNNMRGFYQGRYRAQNMASFISEYRVHLVSRFSGCLFGGIGDVYNEACRLKMTDIKFSYGAGLRFAVLEKEKLNIRLDYGYSNRFNQGIYITFGECF